MHASSRPQRFQAQAILWLLLAAVFARGLLPVGYMPGFKTGAPVVLCTQDGPVTLAARDAAGAHAQEHCPFGFAIGMAAAPALPGTVEVPVSAHEVPAVLAAAAISPSARANYSARAPPYLV